MFALFKAVFADPQESKYRTIDAVVLDEETESMLIYSVIYSHNQFAAVQVHPCVTRKDKLHGIPTSFDGVKDVLEQESKLSDSKMKVSAERGLSYVGLVERLKEDLKDASRDEKALLLAHMFNCMGS